MAQTEFQPKNKRNREQENLEAKEETQPQEANEDLIEERLLLLFLNSFIQFFFLWLFETFKGC